MNYLKKTIFVSINIIKKDGWRNFLKIVKNKIQNLDFSVDDSSYLKFNPVMDLKQDWEDLAKLDPLFSILTVSEAKFNKWDLDKFFSTGKNIIQRHLKIAFDLGYPKEHGKALDFGCGVGRLTRAMSDLFTDCYGVDISKNMIKKAKLYNKQFHNCHFIVNDQANLKYFANDYFDLINAYIVLQHIPDVNVIKFYILEFMRTIKKGGIVVFQLPDSYNPSPNRDLLSTTKFSRLRKGGADPKELYEKQNLTPMIMNFVSEEEIVSLLSKNNFKILKIVRKTHSRKRIVHDRIYFVTK